MSMGFKCDCGYTAYSTLYRGYSIIDGEKKYFGHPGDCFADFKEYPYINEETHVITWATEEEAPEGCIIHFVGCLFNENEEIVKRHTPFCPDCKKELKMSGFLGCI